jgi:hypothetical protein
MGLIPWVLVLAHHWAEEDFPTPNRSTVRYFSILVPAFWLIGYLLIWPLALVALFVCIAGRDELAALFSHPKQNENKGSAL